MNKKKVSLQDFNESYELDNNVVKSIPNPLVSVKTITYNHASFISECIEGVLMQKTTFPFEYVIGEDYSTDETRKIVLEYAIKYPNIIRVILADKNVGIRINSTRTTFICRGKFIAICEGDDYWTDPYKLQKQVDFLEANPEYGLVASDYTRADEEGNELPDTEIVIKRRSLYRSSVTFFELFSETNIIGTLTTCFRADLSKIIAERVENENLWFTYDYWVWLQIAMRSKIHIIKERTACYRNHSNGISKSPGFLNRQKRYYMRYDILYSFCRMNKERISKEHKKILFLMAARMLFMRYGTVKMKFNMAMVIVRYFPGVHPTISNVCSIYKKKLLKH